MKITFKKRHVLFSWRTWFAWRPVKINSTWFWLERVERSRSHWPGACSYREIGAKRPESDFCYGTPMPNCRCITEPTLGKPKMKIVVDADGVRRDVNNFSLTIDRQFDARSQDFGTAHGHESRELREAKREAFNAGCAEQLQLVLNEFSARKRKRHFTVAQAISLIEKSAYKKRGRL
jgi:hypothetical protein